MEAAVALFLAAGWARAEPVVPTIQLRVHAGIASVWLSIDSRGRLSLREQLAQGIHRQPRSDSKKVGKARVRELLAKARKAGFFELEDRYVEPGERQPTFHLDIASGALRHRVTVQGTPPPAFQAVVDSIERIYGKPLMPGVPLPAPRDAPPDDPAPQEAPVRYPSPNLDPRTR